MNGGQTPDELVAIRTTKLSNQLKEYENLLNSPLLDPSMVYIGDGYFASMPKEKAQEFIKRKIELINEELTTLYQLNGVNEDGLPVFDIVEELDDNDEVVTSKVNRTGLSAELANLKQNAQPRISEVPPNAKDPHSADATKTVPKLAKADQTSEAKAAKSDTSKNAAKNAVKSNTSKGIAKDGATKSGTNRTVKSDTARSDTPKSDTPKPDTPKSDTPKSDTPKPDTPKSDTPKSDTPKSDTLKHDNERRDTTKSTVHANTASASAKADIAKTAKNTAKNATSSNSDAASANPADSTSSAPKAVNYEPDLGSEDIERFEEDKSGGDFRDIDPSDVLELHLESESDDNEVDFNFDELEIDEDDAYEFHEGDSSESDDDDDDDDDDNQTDYNFGWGAGGLFPNNESTLKAIEAHLAQQKMDEAGGSAKGSNAVTSGATSEADSETSSETANSEAVNSEATSSETKSNIKNHSDGRTRNAHVHFAENIDIREFETNSNERKNVSLDFYSSPSLSRFKSLRQSAPRIQQPLAGPNGSSAASGAVAGAAAAAAAASRSPTGPKTVHGSIVERDPTSPPKKPIHHIRPVPRATLKQVQQKQQPKTQPQKPQSQSQHQLQKPPSQSQPPQQQKPQSDQQKPQSQPQHPQSHPQQQQQQQSQPQQLHPPEPQQPQKSQQPQPSHPQPGAASASFLRKPTIPHHTPARQKPAGQAKAVPETAPTEPAKPNLKEKVAADAQRIFEDSFMPDVEFLKLHDKEGEGAEQSATKPKADSAADANKPILSSVMEKEDDTVMEDEPDENSVNMTEIKQEYQRLRQQLIYESGGFKKKDSEKEIEPIDDSGAPKKVSRFKAARIS